MFDNKTSAADGDRSKRGASVPVKRRSRPSGPKLTVLSANGGSVECQLETSNKKTVTFRFNMDDMVPADVANKLVSSDLNINQFLDHNFEL